MGAILRSSSDKVKKVVVERIKTLESGGNGKTKYNHNALGGLQKKKCPEDLQGIANLS